MLASAGVRRSETESLKDEFVPSDGFTYARTLGAF